MRVIPEIGMKSQISKDNICLQYNEQVGILFDRCTVQTLQMCTNIYTRLHVFEFTKILLLSETYRRPNIDLNMLHWRLTCLIVDPSETNMPDPRPIRDRHA